MSLLPACLRTLGGDPHLLVFEADDMREVMNDWPKHPETWSNSLSALNDMQTNQTYQFSKHSKFNTMLFQPFGNKSLVELFVQYPVSSAEQPAELLRCFAQTYQSFRSSAEAARAREISKPKEPGQMRPSKEIYNLQQRRAHGKWIADWIAEDGNNWYLLSPEDQRLWTEYTSGDIKRRITEAKQRQQPKFPARFIVMTASDQSQPWVATLPSAERPE